MAPVIVAPPLSKTSSTVSRDDIPSQPLDPIENEAEPLPLHGYDRLDDTPQSRARSSAGVNHHTATATAFHKLPVEVIQRILWMVDANTFASLVLSSKAWYSIAQNKELYAHHLSRCPSYALANTVITGPFRKNDLLRLKSKFAQEVRRNLFQAYLRPRHTLINLISVNASSSAALPGAEAFRFSFSPNGRTILALSSSRIYVIDATSDIITVRRELKPMRRPLSASITDDGLILAVLSSKYQANIYQLNPAGVKHSQVLVMDNPPRTITLAPEGTVLAAAYDAGVEVFSLAPSALSTDRRAVRSEAIDSLNFSGDGSILVGSTQSLDEPSAVVITAPFYTENDLPPKEVHSRMWTTQILFPQISSICSHAELLQGHTEGDANWLFAYDHTLMTYRAVRTDDTRTGVAYFLNPIANVRFDTPMPCMAPTATACGTLVVAGFGENGLWIYGIPEKLDVCPDMGSVVERNEQRLRGGVRLTSATGHLEPLMAYSPSISGSSEEIEDDSIAAKVDWRESLFVKGQQIRGFQECTAAKWVEISEEQEVTLTGKRLVVIAPGGIDQFVEELGDETMPVDGSRVAILDFDYSPSAGQDREITIEVGDNEPELLTEQMSDMDIEVAMERRRTVRDRGRGGTILPLGRSATAAATKQGSSWAQRQTGPLRPSSPLDIDAQMAQAHAQSQVQQPNAANLYRSATAAGFTTARYPPRPPLSTQQQDPAYIPHQPYPPVNVWDSPPPPYATNFYESVEPGMSLGSPLGQSTAVVSHDPMDAGLGGISENAHPSVQNQVHPARQDFDHTHFPRPSHYQTPVASQPHSNLNADFGYAPTGRSTGHYGSSTHGASQHAANSRLPYNSSPSALDAPTNPSPKPESHEGQVSPLLTPGGSSPFNVNHPIRRSPDASPTGQPSPLPTPLGSITLTGNNLQARLNHPVPPVPPTSEATRTPQGPIGQPTAPLPLPDNRDQNSAEAPSALAAQYSVAPPTPGQMANLNRRISQTKRKLLAPTSLANTKTHNMSGKGRVPTPPRAAWGAAGTPGSPSFNNAINLPNGLSRSSSRNSGRSISFSASTPNLRSLTGGYTDRPRMDRLETIESVSSSYGPGEPGFRSHAVPNGAGPNTITYSPQQFANGYGHPNSQSPYQQAGALQATVWADSGDGLFGSAIPESSKKTKIKRRKGGPELLGRAQTMPTSTAGGPTPKKERRCIVM
ncbi:hypothetical protein A1O1_02200 [Capronia coronata CBS 617.96]|uniref:F-box domain-containing protein n=1 Tax=Capronia coronata CBS 617.96 TaxID=1182541 RepID=W9YLN4_9EURO|nr:uncharacterized protein A1O1_02200 [Capronia coronata CBS 617.96]EXJ93807.1 hypothetical protein A1O1_02200 [Capronia coronata CBS 617.96]